MAKKLFLKKAVDVHAATNMFKDAENLEQKFKVVADVLSDVHFRSSNDKKAVKEIVNILSNSKIELKNSDLVFNITGEKAEEISELLSMENDKGVLEPIIPAEEYSSPEKVLYAVKTYVEYAGARDALSIAIATREKNRADGLVKNNEEIKKELLEYTDKLSQATKKIDDLTTEVSYYKSENFKNKKYKKVSRIVMLAAAIALAGTLTATVALGVSNCGLKNDNKALRESITKISIERDAALKELDEIMDIFEENGISVTDQESISDAVQLLISNLNEDSQIDINQMYEIFLKPLEAVGLDINEVIDENGKLILDNVPEAIEGVVNGVLADIAELSSVKSTVEDLYTKAEIVKQDGTFYSVSDFESLGGEDGAIAYIVSHYKNQYAQAYKNLITSLATVENLEKEINELEDIYGELYSTVLDLQDRYDDLSDDYETLLALYNSSTEENAGLKEENSGLKDENTGLKEENSGLKDENADLKDENEELKNQSSLNPDTSVGGSGTSSEDNSNNKQPVSDEQVTDETTTGKDQQNATEEIEDPSLELGE